jgi:hypothetical protein
MPQQTNLAHELAKLEDADWFAVLEEAVAKRRARTQNPNDQADRLMSRDQFACWIARRHFATDPGIREVYYLPHASPPNEVRLLEINTLLDLPNPQGPLEPVDFTPETSGIPYRVLVADVTPDQWQAIQSHQFAIPTGWALNNAHHITR